MFNYTVKGTKKKDDIRYHVTYLDTIRLISYLRESSFSKILSDFELGEIFDKYTSKKVTDDEYLDLATLEKKLSQIKEKIRPLKVNHTYDATFSGGVERGNLKYLDIICIKIRHTESSGLFKTTLSFEVESESEDVCKKTKTFLNELNNDIHVYFESITKFKKKIKQKQIEEFLKLKFD